MFRDTFVQLVCGCFNSSTFKKRERAGERGR